MSSEKDNTPCILLVDEDCDWRSAIREAMVAAGQPWNVWEVSDKQEALDCLRRRGAFERVPRTDMIFIDCQMPNGLAGDLLKQLKSDPKTKDIPVVVLAGDGNQAEQSVPDGADECLCKSADSQEMIVALESSVSKWLGPAAGLTEAIDDVTKAPAISVEVEHSIQSPRILLIEDDPDQQDLISEVLKAHFDDPLGKRIYIAGTGTEAMEQDLSGFDIVLLDYNLPDATGISMLERILAKADVPVVMVTGEKVATTAAQAIHSGAQDYIVKLGDYLFALPIVVEKNVRLHRIKSENEQLRDTLQHKNSELENSLKKLRMMAGTDPLTGLANRRCFAELLESYYNQAVRYGHDLTCCMCDLDHFKTLNDMRGHQVGDEIMMLTAHTIRDSLRASDVAARYGGDEFVVLLPHTSIEMGLSAGERIRRDLVLGTQDDPKLKCPVTMSIGVASLRTDEPASGDALVSIADRALYVAKDRGKDRICASNQTTSQHTERWQEPISIAEENL